MFSVTLSMLQELELLGHRVPMFRILKKLQILKAAALFSFTTTLHEDSSFSTCLPMLVTWPFYYSHPSVCEVTFLCGVDLHLSDQ